MKKRLLVTAMLGSALAASMHPAAASEPVAQAASDAALTSDDAWRFRVTAYAWLMSASGNATARGQTVDFNASFAQLIQKSYSLIGWMSYFEGNKGPVGFYVDCVWSKLGFSNSTASYRNPLRGLQLSSTANQALTYSTTIVEAGALHEVAHWPGSPGSFTAVDVLLGFRYWNNSVDMTFDRTDTADFSRTLDFSRLGFDVSRSGDSIAVELPLVAVSSERLPGELALDAETTDVAGYRALSTKYSTGSGIDTRGIDVVLHGPIFGVSVRF